MVSHQLRHLRPRQQQRPQPHRPLLQPCATQGLTSEGVVIALKARIIDGAQPIRFHLSWYWSTEPNGPQEKSVSLPASTSSYVIPDIEATSYRFEISTEYDNGQTVTESDNFVFQAPKKPKTKVDVTHNSIRLTWDALDDDSVVKAPVDSYELTWRRTSEGSKQDMVEKLSGTVTSHTIKDLLGSTQYTISLQPKNSIGNGVTWSDTVETAPGPADFYKYTDTNSLGHLPRFVV